MTRKISILLWICILSLGSFSRAEADAQRIYRIMPVGDSITEGRSDFSCYRYPLWEKLFTAGYLVEYVGSRTNESRIGPLPHEGYGGMTPEFIATNAVSSFQKYPADIVLLHAGGNHFSVENPVDGIVAANESMIRGFRKVNTNVIVLLAQVIPSGKLPKYSYFPQLNEKLSKLAARLNTPSQPVILVNQAEGFDWRTDTINDHVHPNAMGAEKMACRWFAALTNLLATPEQSFHPKIVSYKKIGGVELTLHIFLPSACSNAAPRPAIIFFFGGACQAGTPLQFYPECAHFAGKGFVAISADYRTGLVNHTTPLESVADGKSAIRWLRQHATEWGIDPARIVAAGASAGGQVAAAAGIVPGLDEPGEDFKSSSQPDALILWYPIGDKASDGYGYDRVKERFTEISPLHNIDLRTPPTLVFLDAQDKLIPVKTGEEFKTSIEKAGGRCELKLFAGAGHPIYEYRHGNSPYRCEILADADAFLAALGFFNMPGAPKNGINIYSTGTP
jgi:acetyl esterase/lipase